MANSYLEVGRPQLGPGSEFGFENLLHFFNLLAPTLQTDPSQVRPEFGFGSAATCPEKNLLRFFSLLSRFGTLPASHNRQVEGSSPSGPTTFYKYHRLITA